MSENWADCEESGGTGMPSNLEPVWGGVRPVCREFWKWAARPKQTGPSVGDATDRQVAKTRDTTRREVSEWQLAPIDVSCPGSTRLTASQKKPREGWV